MKQIISCSKPDLPRSNKNKISDSSIIPDKNQQCQGFRDKRIENDGYGDLADEIIGDILAAGGQDA